MRADSKLRHGPEIEGPRAVPLRGLFGGMSGCTIELLRGGLVRKSSPGQEYNDRLRRQAKKQDLFSCMDLKNASVPKVVQTGESGGVFYFDMEYAPGLGMKEFLSHADTGSLRFVLESLCSYIHQMRSMSRPRRSDGKFIKKIHELMDGNKNSKTLEKIALMVEADGMTTPLTMCHGDLTLANVIFQKNRLCFVDFLDSYVDTYLCDLAKLKQDLFYLWTPSVRGFLDLRTAQSCEFLWRGFEREFHSDMSTREFEIIDLINLMRIEPYVRTKAQRLALDSALKRNTLYHEDTDRSHGRRIA